MDLTKRAVTYGFHGVTETESALLQGMIGRIARRLPGPVAHVSAHEAQLVFSDGSAPALEGTCAQLVRLVRDAEAREFPGSLRMPPHVTDVFELFTDFIKRDADERARCGVMRSLIRSLHDLFRTRGAPHALVDGDEEGARLILYPADRQFSWAGAQGSRPLSEMFQSQRIPRLGLRPWDAAEPGARGKRHGIEPLFWHMGLAHGRCGLLPWVGRDDVLRMRAWPYLAGQGPGAALRLATVLRARPRSVAGLAEAARVPETDAVAFANAALLCGFVVSAAAADAQGLVPAPEVRSAGMKVPGFERLPGILGAIRDVLGMRS